jgi:hypothetical protein
MIILGPIVKIAGAGDVTVWYDTNTTINVTVNSEVPSINFYDFQNSTNISKLDSRIDVAEEYQFVVNVTDLQGWDDIDYINITAWFDNGSQSATYNQTAGGNLNMYLQYENKTGTANWSMLWPDDEVYFTDANCTETIISSTTHNLTFKFTPRYQVRYSSAGTGAWSWNFTINVDDDSEDNTSTNDEYGVFMYTRIVQTTENPAGTANPGQNDVALSPHTNVTTRCNANYTLTTNLPNLTDGSGHYILNSSLSVQGGNITRRNFDGDNATYLWGTLTTYRNHLNDTYEDTTEVEYWVNCSLGQFPGWYESTVTYTLTGEV